MKSNLKIVNFISPVQSLEVYMSLVGCTMASFEFQQTESILREQGYVITEKQYTAFKIVLNEMLELDIGCLQHLLNRTQEEDTDDDYSFSDEEIE